MPKAAGTFMLGLRGEIHAGDEIPKTYVDSVGAEQPTDFDRLRELDLVEDAKAARGRAKADGEPASAVEPAE